MRRQKDLVYFMNLKYNIILKHHNNRYYLFIPELSLIAEGDTLEGAFKIIEQEKEAYFKRMIAMNNQDTITEPLPQAYGKRLLNAMGLFFIKAVIVTAMLFMLIAACQPIVDASLNNISNMLFMKARNFAVELVDKTGNKLETMTPEERDAMRQKLRKIVKGVTPYMQELNVLFNDMKAESPKGKN